MVARKTVQLKASASPLKKNTPAAIKKQAPVARKRPAGAKKPAATSKPVAQAKKLPATAKKPPAQAKKPATTAKKPTTPARKPNAPAKRTPANKRTNAANRDSSPQDTVLTDCSPAKQKSSARATPAREGETEEDAACRRRWNQHIQRTIKLGKKCRQDLSEAIQEKSKAKFDLYERLMPQFHHDTREAMSPIELEEQPTARHSRHPVTTAHERLEHLTLFIAVLEHLLLVSKYADEKDIEYNVYNTETSAEAINGMVKIVRTIITIHGVDGFLDHDGNPSEWRSSAVRNSSKEDDEQEGNTETKHKSVEARERARGTYSEPTEELVSDTLSSSFSSHNYHEMGC